MVVVRPFATLLAFVAVASLLFSCHRIFPYNGLPDASPPRDFALDGPDGALRDIITDATADSGCSLGPFSAPTELPIVSDPTSDDWSPHLSSDQRAIYFQSWRIGGKGSSDIWVATRPGSSEDFSMPRSLDPPVNSKCVDSGPAISADGLTLFFVTGRKTVGGSCVKDTDIWVATRASSQSPFANAVPVAELNSPQQEISPTISRDGLTIYFASKRAASRKADIFVASRNSPREKFSPPEKVANVNSANQDRKVFVAPDQLTLYISSDRPGGAGKVDIWVSTRQRPDQLFSTPVLLGVKQSANDDVVGYVAEDGKTIYYNYQTDLSGNTARLRANIWVSKRKCLGP